MIPRNRISAIVAVSSLEIADAKTAPPVDDQRCMILIVTQLPWTEPDFVDTKGNPPPPPAKGWTTAVPCVERSPAHSDRDIWMSSITTEVRPEGCTKVDLPDRGITRIMALPVWHGEVIADHSYCPPNMARDTLSLEELDMVCP